MVLFPHKGGRRQASRFANAGAVSVGFYEEGVTSGTCVATEYSADGRGRHRGRLVSCLAGDFTQLRLAELHLGTERMRCRCATSTVAGTAQAPGSDRTFAMDEHPTNTVGSDSATGVRTSTEGALLAESAVGVTEFVCGPLGGNGRRAVPERLCKRAPPAGRLGHPVDERVQIGVGGGPRGGPGETGDTRVLIVDDSRLYREYLAGVIAAHGVVNPGVAWDLPSLITAIENMKPRVILFNMATRDNAMLLRQALKLSPTMRVIVLGMSEDDESEIVACAEAGVAGYHLRTESLGDLLILIQKVAAGESLCSPRISAILLRRLSALASQRQPTEKELVLTAREAQILKMLELGLSNRDIADQLCIAVHTVKNHVHSLLTKLGVRTRAQAAALSRTIRYTEDESRN